QKSILYMLSISLLASSIYFFSHYFGSEFKGKRPTTSSHILFWNVADNKPLPTDIIIRHILDSKPKIIALVEAFEVSDEDLNILKSACPEYQFNILEGDMIIGVKGTIDTVIYASESVEFRYNYIKVNVDQQIFSIMIADLYASPLFNKNKPLDV